MLACVGAEAMVHDFPFEYMKYFVAYFFDCSGPTANAYPVQLFALSVQPVGVVK